MRELEEYYSYSDALDMAEVIQVQRHNERMAYKAAEKRR